MSLTVKSVHSGTCTSLHWKHFMQEPVNEKNDTSIMNRQHTRLPQNFQKIEVVQPKSNLIL